MMIKIQFLIKLEQCHVIVQNIHDVTKMDDPLPEFSIEKCFICASVEGLPTIPTNNFYVTKS